MPTPPLRIPRAKLAEGRRRYEQTREPVDDIAAFLGIGTRTFHTYLRRWGWRGRRKRIPSQSPPPAREPVEAQRAAAAAQAAQQAILADGAPVAERIRRTVERELAAIEHIIAKLEPGSTTGEAERAARVLASLTRTLHEVMRLDVPREDGKARSEEQNGRGPDDPDEFIRGLARRMDEFARRAKAALPDGAAPAGMRAARQDLVPASPPEAAGSRE